MEGGFDQYCFILRRIVCSVSDSELVWEFTWRARMRRRKERA